jgi:hypothetical protein
VGHRPFTKGRDLSSPLTVRSSTDSRLRSSDSDFSRYPVARVKDIKVDSYSHMSASSNMIGKL